MEPIMKETTKRMVVELSSDEVASLGMRLADKEIEYKALAAEKKKMDDQYNAKLHTIEAEIDTLARETHEHKAERDVQIRELFDDAREMVEQRKLLTNDFIGTREYTMQERGEKTNRTQGSLPLGDAAAPAEAGAGAGAAGEAEDDDEGDGAEEVQMAPTDPSELTPGEEEGDDEDEETDGETKAAGETNGQAGSTRRRVPRGLPPEEGVS